MSCRHESNLTFKQRFEKLKTLKLPLVLKDVRDIPKYIDNANWTWDSSAVGKNVIPVGFITKTSSYYSILFTRQYANGAFIATFDTVGFFIDSISLPIGNFTANGSMVHFLSHTITNDTLETKGYIINPETNPFGNEHLDTLFIAQGNIITLAGKDTK